MFPKSLAELKKTADKFKFTMVQNTFAEVTGRVNPLLGVPRKVAVLSTVGIQFEPVAPETRGSNLRFGKAKSYKFEGNKITVDIEDSGMFNRTMTYILEEV